MDLDSMKYAELQSLAKQLGLKANMKAQKLLNAIKQHYQQEKRDEEQEQGNDVKITAAQEDENPAQSSTSVFVSTRRGKGNGTKRKMTETEMAPEFDGEAQSLPSATEGDCEAAAPSPPSVAINAKKRRVSSPKISEKMDNDPPTEPPAKSVEKQKGNKNEATVHFNIGNAPSVPKGGKIPRYKGVQGKRALKPVTPNFKKLHEAHFNKMESIDSYVQRRTKQMETLRTSVKELKVLSDKTKQEQVDGKAQAKAKPVRTSLFSPAPERKAAIEDKRRATVLSANKVQSKPAAKEDASFRPSVLSTRRINVRFSEATHDNEHKRSLVKTPARKSLGVISNTPLQLTADGTKSMNTLKTSTSSTTKTPATFVFTGNTSTPGTQKKANFDLKASLSRPLSYKPHTGKLKPFGESKENTAANKSINGNSHQKNYKQHQVQTREERRTKQTEDRKQKKANMLGARRGLVMM